MHVPTYVPCVCSKLYLNTRHITITYTHRYQGRSLVGVCFYEQCVGKALGSKRTIFPTVSGNFIVTFTIDCKSNLRCTTYGKM